jgi:hypothetical protein
LCLLVCAAAQSSPVYAEGLTVGEIRPRRPRVAARCRLRGGCSVLMLVTVQARSS